MDFIVGVILTLRYVKLSVIFLKGVQSGGLNLSDLFRKRIVDLDVLTL